MSDAKQIIREVQSEFDYTKKVSQDYANQTAKFDRELSSKIKKVQESSEEVIKHIEKRSQ